jgi:hypothetical protein
MLVVGTAAIAQSTGIINACYQSKSGDLRIETTQKPCNSKNETALSWNKEGAEGPAGPAGPQGEEGPPGPANVRQVTSSTPAPGNSSPVTALCDPGEKVTGGGFSLYQYDEEDTSNSVQGSLPVSNEGPDQVEGWRVFQRGPGADAYALCASTTPSP